MTAIKKKFSTIDGLRTILSLWVIACHVCQFFNLFIYVYHYNQRENTSDLTPTNAYIRDETFRLLLNAYWPKLVIGLGYQVDVFFLISSFLFVHHLLGSYFSIQKTNNHFQNSIMKDVLLLIIRRLFRFWPLLILSIGFTCILGDFNCNNINSLLSLLAFPIDCKNIPVNFMVLWSTNVDIVNSIIVYLVFYLLVNTAVFSYLKLDNFDKPQQKGIFWLINLLGIVLVGGSLIPKLWRYYYPNVTVLSLLLLPGDAIDSPGDKSLLSYYWIILSRDIRSHVMALFLTKDRLDYYHHILFQNVLTPTSNSIEFPDLNKAFETIMTQEYVVYHQRITVFFIGFYMALVYFFDQEYTATKKEFSQMNKPSDYPTERPSETSSEKRKSPDCTIDGIKYILYRAFHAVVFTMAILFVLEPIWIGLDKENHVKSVEDLTHLNYFQMSGNNTSYNYVATISSNQSPESTEQWMLLAGNASKTEIKIATSTEETQLVCLATNVSDANNNNTVMGTISSDHKLDIFWLDFFVSVLNRPLYAASVGYVLYRTLLPAYHPLYLTFISKLLNCNILQYLSNYSYGIYIFHTRLILELMLRTLPFPKMFGLYFHLFLKPDETMSDNTYPGIIPIFSEETILFLIYLTYYLITVLATLIVAIVVTEYYDVLLRKFYLNAKLKKLEQLIIFKKLD